jgi:hypothetical protein
MTEKEKGPEVELSLSDRFQGGFCQYFNTPLPNPNSCEHCINCGKSVIDGSLICRIGALL